MKSTPKTYLELINRIGQQSREAELKYLVDAAWTSAQIIADAVQIKTTIDDVSVINDIISGYYSRSCGCDSSCICAEDIDVDSMYLSIAERQPDTINTVILGGCTYEKENRNKYLIIGGIVLKIDVWKIENKVLKIFVPYLFAHAYYSEGICEVIAGGIPYYVPVCEPVETKFRVISAWMTKVGQYPAIVVVNGNRIRATFGHSAQCFCLVVDANQCPVIDYETVFYKLNESGDITVMSPKTICNNPCTYSSYLVPYEARPIINPVDLVSYIRLVFPNYGMYTVEITINAITM